LRYALVKTDKALVIERNGERIVYAWSPKKRLNAAKVAKLAKDKQPIPSEHDLASHWSLVGTVDQARKAMGGDFDEANLHLSQLEAAFS
jgi:hypothetical protein